MSNAAPRITKIGEKEPLSLEVLRSRLLHSARNFEVALEQDALGARRGEAREGVREGAREGAREIDWPELADLLPDGGLPRGVVELSSPHAVGGATEVAFAAIRTAQKKTSMLPKTLPAVWIDADATLYAPGALRAGVDLARLLVVRPPRAELERIAVKVARSGAFDIVVVDVDPVFGGVGASPCVIAKVPKKQASNTKSKMEVVVRKLALAAEENGMTVILITDARRARAVPWPVAMRLEIERVPGKIGVRVAKERHGRIGGATWIPYPSRELGSGEDA